MTKAELIDRVHAAAGDGLTRRAVAELVDGSFDAIVEALQGGRPKFTISGFGSFYLKDRKARTGRNPQTGEPLDIPASKAVTFKLAAAFKRGL